MRWAQTCDPDGVRMLMMKFLLGLQPELQDWMANVDKTWEQVFNKARFEEAR